MQGRTRGGSGPSWGKWGALGRRMRGYGQRWLGGDWEGEPAVKEEPPPPPGKAKPPPRKPLLTETGDKKTSRWHCESVDSSDEAISPPPNKRKARPPKPLPVTNATSGPKTTPPPPEGGGGWCRRPPGRHQSPSPVPHAHGSGHRHRCPPEHRRKAAVVWVEYPGNPTPYEVARCLLFPFPEPP